MATLTMTETLETLHCASCDILFAIPKSFQKNRRDDHKGFMCPNGHSNVYLQETDEEKFRRERDIAQQALARVEDEKRIALAKAAREVTAAKRETKRLKKRASVGVCPCCSRTVSQLARHMKTKHPEFVSEETTNVVPIKKAAK